MSGTANNDNHLKYNQLGEAYFDLTSIAAHDGSFKFAVRGKPYKSLIIETAPDGEGRLSGAVAVYLGSAVNGRPWRTVAMGGGRGGPVPTVDFLTFVPIAGSQGIVSVTLSTEIWGTFFKQPSAGEPTLEELSDVGISAPSNGQVLTYESGIWANRTPGAVTNPSVVQSTPNITNSPGIAGWATTPTPGNLLVVAMGKNSDQTPPANWTSVGTYAGVQCFAKIAAGDSTDNINLTGFGALCAIMEEFANATSVYAITAGSTGAGGANMGTIKLSLTGYSLCRAIVDGVGTISYPSPNWGSMYGGNVGGRNTTIMGTAFPTSAEAYCQAVWGNGNSGNMLIYAVK